MNTTVNLTPGTPVTVKGEFIRVHSDGDFLINILQTSGAGDLRKEETYVHPSAVTIVDTPPTAFLRPPQVDDKNRRFRQGDIVRIRSSVNGRTPVIFSHRFNTATAYTVTRDECSTGDTKCTVMVGTMVGEDSVSEQFHHSEIELVTPVETMRPYYIREAPQCYELRKMGEDYPSAIFFKHRLADAFATAKIACNQANDTFGQP